MTQSHADHFREQFSQPCFGSFRSKQGRDGKKTMPQHKINIEVMCEGMDHVALIVDFRAQDKAVVKKSHSTNMKISMLWNYEKQCLKCHICNVISN